jgi:hypothetical protein
MVARKYVTAAAMMVAFAPMKATRPPRSRPPTGTPTKDTVLVGAHVRPSIRGGMRS